MSNVTIWHNPRCSKSRQTLQLLRDRGIEPTIVEYLKEALVVPELGDVRGCRPCLSGLERLVVESHILPMLR